jgi:16S rRNA (cytidine1402-2'-O)-methyltransferase
LPANTSIKNLLQLVYLIPTLLDEEAIHTLSQEVAAAIRNCSVFFVENERSARRFVKKVWKEMVIDDFQWVLADQKTVHEAHTRQLFSDALASGKNIGILSEAGCPGIADPGQELVALAHQQGVTVKPLVGPSSILLALMASGLNGQTFCFSGYLPIEKELRTKKIRELELESVQKNRTQIFMETPYRNQAMLEALLNTCKKNTLLCIAAGLTGPKEFILTKPIGEWKNVLPDLHKKPCLFLLLAQ